MIEIADPEEIMKILEKAGRGNDEAVDLVETALLLAGLNHEGLSFSRYRNHIDQMVDDVARRHKELQEAGAEDDVKTRVAALKHIIFDREGYSPDLLFRHVDSSDLIRVIDERKGADMALAILCIHVGRMQGWELYGLNIPGHFMVRVDQGAERLIVNPLDNLAIMQAPDLRKLVKKSLGERAELSANYYEAVTNKACLVFLQNNIKLYQIAIEDYEGALATVRTIEIIDPEEYRILLDMGVLCARTSRFQEAIFALERYIKKAPEGRDRHEAAMLLREIQMNLP